MTGNGNARDKARIVVPRRHVMIMETAGHRSFWGAEMFFLFRATLCRRLALHLFQRRNALEQFQFETLRVSNHTACRFAEKTRFFRSLWAGRRCAAASRFTFFKGETP